MAGLLSMLSKQPTPLLQRLNLDKQPEQPLIAKLLPGGKKERTIGRYAIASTPHGFLAKQPKKPLLANVTLWKKPMFNQNVWVSAAPLSALAKPGNPLIGQLGSTRAPGIVTAVLLLGLSLSYLASQLESSTTTEAPQVAEQNGEETSADPVTTTDAESTEAVAEADAPAENTATTLAAVSETATTSEADAPAGEAQVAETAAEETPPAKVAEPADSAPEPKPAKNAETKAPEEANKFSLAPLTPDEEAEISAIIAEARGEPATEKTADSNAEAVAVATAANLMKKEEPATAAEPKTQPKPEPKPEPKPASLAPPAPVTQPVEPAPAKAEKETEQPPVTAATHLSEARSADIMDSAKFIYQLGDGTMAIERVGLALAAGHVHPDYVPKLQKLEADIKSLLSLFDEAVNTNDPKQAALKRAAFLDAEQAVMGANTSAYATRLELAAKYEIENDSQ